MPDKFRYHNLCVGTTRLGISNVYSKLVLEALNLNFHKIFVENQTPMCGSELPLCEIARQKRGTVLPPSRYHDCASLWILLSTQCWMMYDALDWGVSKEEDFQEMAHYCNSLLLHKNKR